MFDIGFWEIVVVAVVALLVVGPDEFPTLVRNIGGWLGKLRRFVSETKNDLEQEFRKADELKQLMAREADIAELHEQVDARSIKNDTPAPAPAPRPDTSESRQDEKQEAVPDSEKDAAATRTPEASPENKH
jgi:sec-independent protein translocase protein TatB